MTRATTHLKNINVNDEYGTPKRVFERACNDFSIFPTIDICASKNNHVVSNYLTKFDNCFMHNIEEDFFMNPPYSKIKSFMRFAWEQHHRNDLNALILTFAKTDTEWWHDYVENQAEVHFIKGRIQFNDFEGNPTKIFDRKTGQLKNGFAPYGSCWIIFRMKGKHGGGGEI